MSAEYLMRIRRKDDGKLLGSVLVNEVKNLFDVEKRFETESLMDIDRLYELADKYDRRRLELLSEARELSSHLHECVSVEVKRDMEEDIECKRELADNYRWAASSVQSILGKWRCIVEDRVVVEGDDSTLFALNHNGMVVDGTRGICLVEDTTAELEIM